MANLGATRRVRFSMRAMALFVMLSAIFAWVSTGALGLGKAFTWFPYLAPAVAAAAWVAATRGRGWATIAGASAIGALAWLATFIGFEMLQNVHQNRLEIIAKHGAVYLLIGAIYGSATGAVFYALWLSARYLCRFARSRRTR